MRLRARSAAELADLAFPFREAGEFVPDGLRGVSRLGTTRTPLVRVRQKGLACPYRGRVGEAGSGGLLEAGLEARVRYGLWYAYTLSLLMHNACEHRIRPERNRT